MTAGSSEPLVRTWRLSGRTCERGGRQPVDLRVRITLSAGADPVVTGISLTAAGPGITCGERWSPAWAERAVAKLGWVGLPLCRILNRPMPPDPFDCACTEVSLAPKVWRLLASMADGADG